MLYGLPFRDWLRLDEAEEDATEEESANGNQIESEGS